MRLAKLSNEDYQRELLSGQFRDSASAKLTGEFCDAPEMFYFANFGVSPGRLNAFWDIYQTGGEFDSPTAKDVRIKIWEAVVAINSPSFKKEYVVEQIKDACLAALLAGNKTFLDLEKRGVYSNGSAIKELFSSQMSACFRDYIRDRFFIGPRKPSQVVSLRHKQF